jgi:hypothetical protein
MNQLATATRPVARVRPVVISATSSIGRPVIDKTISFMNLSGMRTILKKGATQKILPELLPLIAH